MNAGIVIAGIHVIIFWVSLVEVLWLFWWRSASAVPISSIVHHIRDWGTVHGSHVMEASAGHNYFGCTFWEVVKVATTRIYTPAD